MCCEPIFGQDLLRVYRSREDIFEFDPHQQRVLGDMKDAVAVLGKRR